MKILVLSGGGSHGAYQVGVLKKLVEMGKSWDLIAGVSVGALNGACLAQHNKKEIKLGLQILEMIWLSITGTKDVMKPWLPGVLNYIPAYFKGGLNSTAPLLNIIQSNFDEISLKNSDVDLRIGVVSLYKGQYHTIKKEIPDLPRWILASCAMPVVMPPVELEGDKWVDGGVRNQTPLASIIDVISEKSGKEAVEIEIILTAPLDKNLVEQPKNVNNLLAIALRCAEIAIDEIYLGDLQTLKKVANVTIYKPSKILSPNSMEFTPADIRQMIQAGYDETI